MAKAGSTQTHNSGSLQMAKAPRSSFGVSQSAERLTLSNPATILSFVEIFGAMVLGVVVGSRLWWILLSSVVGRLRGRFDLRWQHRVILGSAAVLVVFAVWQLGSIQR